MARSCCGEAVKNANAELIATIEESLKIADEGKAKRAAAEGRTVREVAAARGVSPARAMIDLAVESVDSGELVVIGRDATQNEFESFHGAMGSDVHYFNGMDLFGGNGWPIINSTGKQFAVRDSGGALVDPPAGLLPASDTGTDISYQRDSTDTTAFTENPEADADPGVFSGVMAETGRLVISEISDASAFQYEYVELVYDAESAPPEPEPVLYG